MIQHLNENSRIHVVTLENPIEFVFKDRKSTITQRELGSDTPNMAEALKSALRQDPDVIVISEMRDFETIQTAFTAAETGHLVISTLHTNDAKSAIERMVEVFPSEQQNQVRIQLASSLLAVFSQTLIPKKNGSGRILASEVLIKSPSIEHCLKKGDFDQINALIASSDTYYSMQTLNHELEQLVKRDLITIEEALGHSNNADDLRLRFSGVDRKEGYDLYESYSCENELLETEADSAQEKFPELQEITITQTKRK
jgi:twitching motility protein PilT